jgi:hypothetical protein
MNLAVHFAHLLVTYTEAMTRGEIDHDTHMVLAQGVRAMATKLGVADAMVDVIVNNLPAEKV